MIILCFYTLLAAGIPVWIILQPRDFTNSFLLYLGVAALSLGAIVAGLKGVTFTAPAFNLAEGSSKLGPIWPFLFITVACGAISGFPCPGGRGTSCKQVSQESHIKVIGFGGMLLEGLLAIGVMIAVGCGILFSDYVSITFPVVAGVNPTRSWPLPPGRRTTPQGLRPSLIYGTIFGILLVEGFVVTTLDTAIRLNRYLLEELWQSFPAGAEGLQNLSFQCPVVCSDHVHPGRNQRLYRYLADFRFRQSAVGVVGVDRRVHLADSEKEDRLVYPLAGDLHDGHHHLFPGPSPAP
jgi:carbon starvation protein CstA